MSSGGKSTVVGYRYAMSVHMGLSRGPVNAIKHVKVGDLTAWEGRVEGNDDIDINAPNLFGGDQKEGGVVGTLSVFMGGAAQTFSSAYKALMGGLVPDFRGIVTTFWRGQVAVNNPYPKPWKFRVSRYDAGWDLDAADPARAEVWYANRARILLPGDIEAMNPAHIIYQCLTDRRWGRGLSPAALYEPSFISAANTLCAELFGLCMRWNRQSDIDEFINSVLSHIGATLYPDPETGAIVLKLIRADYEPDDLPVFTYNSGLLEINEDETGGGDSAFSEVNVTYTDPITGNEASVSEKSLALQQANGDVASTTHAYPGVPTAALALRLARRDIDMQAASRRYKLVLDRRGWRLRPGMVIKVTDASRGIDAAILRIGTTEDTELTDGRINITAVEDFFGLSASGYSTPQPATGWSPPDNTALAVSDLRLEEASYRDLARELPTGELSALAADAGLFVVLARQPSGTAINYDIASAATGETMAIRGNGNWTPSDTIDGALGFYDTLVAFGEDADLSALDLDEAMLIGDEIMRVDAVDLDAKTVSVARGCADTLPQQHSTGARAWFYQDLTGTDARDYTDGEDVGVRVLTITPTDRLEIADVASETITIGARQARPYPPGDLRVNGDRFGELDGAYGGEITIGGADRDRLLQSDRLIEHEAADIGPEAGTTYTIRIYDGVSLVRTASSVSSLPWVYTSAMQSSDGEPTEREWLFEVESERGGLTSWQMYRFEVTRRLGVSVSGLDGSVVVQGNTGTSTPRAVRVAGQAGAVEVNET